MKAWIVLWLIPVSTPIVKTSLAILIAFALMCPERIALFARYHDKLHWRDQLTNCALRGGDYAIPVHFDGRRIRLVLAQAAQCNELLKFGLF